MLPMPWWGPWIDELCRLSVLCLSPGAAVLTRLAGRCELFLGASDCERLAGCAGAGIGAPALVRDEEEVACEVRPAGSLIGRVGDLTFGFTRPVPF